MSNVDVGPGPFSTAASHVLADVPTATPASLAEDVRRFLERRVFESVADVAVLDGERLVGLVPIERLLAASPDTPLSELVDGEPAHVAPDVDQEQAAAEMASHAARSLAVVDDTGRFRGLIPSQRMLAVAFEEHEEDLARLGGFLATTAQARTAAEEEIGLRLWHRLPWLLVGLAGAMASAVIVGSFEEDLERIVLLAFFLPGVVYMADAVGTQTEALVIRGIAVGVQLRHVLARELATGAIMGAGIAAAFVPFAWVVWGDASIALAVALALFASCSIATVVAMALPYLLHRLGRDPAFGSGPLATVIQDLLSIVIYFAIAVALAG